MLKIVRNGAQHLWSPGCFFTKNNRYCLASLCRGQICERADRSLNASTKICDRDYRRHFRGTLQRAVLGTSDIDSRHVICEKFQSNFYAFIGGTRCDGIKSRNGSLVKRPEIPD